MKPSLLSRLVEGWRRLLRRPRRRAVTPPRGPVAALHGNSVEHGPQRGDLQPPTPPGPPPPPTG